MKNLPEPAPAETAQEPGKPVPLATKPAASHPRTVWGIVALWLFVGLTRGPLLPPDLYSFDTVNLSLALQDFDPTRNQPQPPGYPLFVAEARALYPLLGSPERTFKVIQLLISGLSVWLLFLMGREMVSEAVGAIAAALFLLNPIFWFSGLTSPLRPHLALFSVLIAWFCWRALGGGARWFYAASLALGVGGGFRPELCLILFPLWLWTGWRSGGMRLVAKGFLILAGVTWLWLSNLAMACGGFLPMIQAFRDYTNSQTFQSGAFWAGAGSGWRHMAGRVLVWSTLGALPWIWALPFAWLRRRQWPQWRLGLVFLAIWTAPAVLFYVSVHSADPDHVLSVIPMVCLVGAFSLQLAEETFQARWKITLPGSRSASWIWLASAAVLVFLLTGQKGLAPAFAIGAGVLFALLFVLRDGFFGVRGALISVALLGNVLFFLGQFPFPAGPPGGSFRGLASLRDAYLGGIYESSYNRVHWVSDMTVFANENLPKLKGSAPGPLLFIWSRDGEPVWRKLAFYFPSEKIYVLDESGDPTVQSSQAGLWTGNKILARYSGDVPIQLPVPRGGRLVWFMGGGKFQELAPIVPLHKMLPFAYTDLAADAPTFRWGSFEFVPQ